MNFHSNNCSLWFEVKVRFVHQELIWRKTKNLNFWIMKKSKTKKSTSHWFELNLLKLTKNGWNYERLNLFDQQIKHKKRRVESGWTMIRWINLGKANKKNEFFDAISIEDKMLHERTHDDWLVEISYPWLICRTKDSKGVKTLLII